MKATKAFDQITVKSLNATENLHVSSLKFIIITYTNYELLAILTEHVISRVVIIIICPQSTDSNLP